MKTDAEVLLMMRERAKGKTQDQSASSVPGIPTGIVRRRCGRCNGILSGPSAFVRSAESVWRARSGPDPEVIFPQVHEPGRMAQSDFTHMSDLGITLAGIAFPHLVFHLVLTYSNAEAIYLCASQELCGNS